MNMIDIVKGYVQYVLMSFVNTLTRIFWLLVM
jgi:hypothetical protein